MTPPRRWTTADFDFELPPELIAQHPAAERSASRLLDGTGLQPVDRIFKDLPQHLNAGDLLVFNDTRVIKARLYGRKATGGAVEVLVERILPQREGKHDEGVNQSSSEVWAHLRASKSPGPGTRLTLGDEATGTFEAEVLGRGGPDGGLFHLRFPQDALALLDRHGHVPLPPYITHEDNADDEARYQTVFAKRPGAVAAPTAALHFDETLLAALRERGVRSASVTLHVGAGTFQPVRADELSQHRMHSEWYEVSAETALAIQATREAGGRIVAVGTTSVRALESAAVGTEERLGRNAPLQSIQGDTSIFITPGYRFRVVDTLITNFHLPRSTLMMLVSAFAGYEPVMALYRHAIEQRYRFFSYGDAMLLARAPLPPH